MILRAVVLLALAPVALAQTAPDCAAVKDDAQRLACYDAASKKPAAPEPAPAPTTAPAPAVPESAPPAANPAPPPASESAPPAATPPPAVAAPASPAPPAPAPAAEEKFGAEQLVTGSEKEKPEVLAKLESHLAGPLRGWERGTLFKLENGQVWKCLDDDRAYFPRIPDKAAVVIRRGFFTGSYWMEIAGADRKVKVQRVR